MKHKDVVSHINKRYVGISSRLIKQYERVFGLPCDLYFPIHTEYNEKTLYRDMKVFGPHQSYDYKKLPDVHTHYYIPFLIKKESMNSSELEFDSFYLETEIDRPFIETTKKRELPIGTKVVVFQGESQSKFFVDKKTVITGADGFMLIRMYLDPLAKDNDANNITEDQEENVDYWYDEEDPRNCHCECDCPEEEEQPQQPVEEDDGVFMNIPDEEE